MSKERHNKIPELLKQLAEGFSKQQRFAAGYWIALAVVSTLTVMPTPKNDALKLPFILTDVPVSDFYPFACILLSLLMIMYGSANAQAIRTRKLITRFIENSKEKYLSPGYIHIQDIFDAIVPTNINRVAPLAQIFLGKHQFFSKSQTRSLLKSISSAFYFAVLKIVGFLVIEVFPGYALVVSFDRGKLFSITAEPWGLPIYFFWFVSIVALFILLQLLYLDVAYAIRSMERILSGHAKKKQKGEKTKRR